VVGREPLWLVKHPRGADRHKAFVTVARLRESAPSNLGIELLLARWTLKLRRHSDQFSQ
jgi:hypothetical protein